jgi:hypothetical protein
MVRETKEIGHGVSVCNFVDQNFSPVHTLKAMLLRVRVYSQSITGDGVS